MKTISLSLHVTLTTLPTDRRVSFIATATGVYSRATHIYSCRQHARFSKQHRVTVSDAEQLMQACTRHEPLSPTALCVQSSRQSLRRIVPPTIVRQHHRNLPLIPHLPSPPRRGGALPVPGSQIDAGASERVQLVARSTHGGRPPGCHPRRVRASEACSPHAHMHPPAGVPVEINALAVSQSFQESAGITAVSYTHLTLPTKRIV